MNAHNYKLSFANSAMIVAHKVNAAKEPISVAEKRQQLTSKLSSIDLTCLFLHRIHERKYKKKRTHVLRKCLLLFEYRSSRSFWSTDKKWLINVPKEREGKRRGERERETKLYMYDAKRDRSIPIPKVEDRLVLYICERRLASLRRALNMRVKYCEKGRKRERERERERDRS